MGLDRPGVFAEQVPVHPGALVPVPEVLANQLAVLVEPLATSVAPLRDLPIEAESIVLVVGGGPIGLPAVWVAAGRGASVLVVEPVARRRSDALGLGAARALERVEDAPPARADLALDAVGLEATWRGAIGGVRAGGTVVVGLAQREGAVPVGDLVRRGVSLRGHYAYTRADIEAALRLLAEGQPSFDWLEAFALGDGAEAFRRLVEEPQRPAKIRLQVAEG